jgi:hypothetical protein
VTPDGDGPEVTFTAHRRPGMGHDALASDASAVADGLRCLRRILERGA